MLKLAAQAQIVRRVERNAHPDRAGSQQFSITTISGFELASGSGRLPGAHGYESGPTRPLFASLFIPGQRLWKGVAMCPLLLGLRTFFSSGGYQSQWTLDAQGMLRRAPRGSQDPAVFMLHPDLKLCLNEHIWRRVSL